MAEGSTVTEVTNSNTRAKQWHLHESNLLLRKCLTTAVENVKNNVLKIAVVENNHNQVCALLKGDRGKLLSLNKLWSFQADGCTLYVPPLCVAICHRSLPLVQLLIQHGANPDRLGRMHIQKQGGDGGILCNITPLMMAVEDHSSQGLPFCPDIATALLQAGADINSRAGAIITEEEEEGGCIQLSAPDTLLLRAVDVFLPYSLPVVLFLLDNGADFYIQDAHEAFTPLQKCLRSLIQRPYDHFLTTCAHELICRGGFLPLTERHLRSRERKNEFVLLVNALSKAVERNKDASVILDFTHLLLDAGYVCSKDDMHHFRKSEGRKVDPCLADKVNGVHVYTLKHLCRRQIRTSKYHWKGLEQVNWLPTTIRNYLKFS